MRTLAFLPLFIFSSFTFSQKSDERAIREVLTRQEKCWNAGDFECFMEGYWKSDRLVFIGSQGVGYGWEQILANYKKSYPDKTTMGQLTFDLIIVEPLSKDFWTVIGKWNLKREKDNPNGYFSLIFRKLRNEWVIISDHSS